MPEGFCGKTLNPDGELPFFTRCAFRIHPRRTNYRIDGQPLYSCAEKTWIGRAGVPADQRALIAANRS